MLHHKHTILVIFILTKILPIAFSFSSPLLINKKSTSIQEAADDRIILVYPLDGCHSPTSESDSDSLLSGLELQSPRRARDLALFELERRVNDLRSIRSGTKGLDLRKLSPTEVDSTSFLSSNDESLSSIRLNTRYLNAIQMEITTVPSFMTSEEMLELSDTLPCVQKVFKDYVKSIEEPPSEPISIDLNRRLSKMELTESVRHTKLGKNRLPDQIHTYPAESSKTEGNNLNRNLQGSGSNNKKIPVSENLVVPNDQLFSDQWHLQQSEHWGIGLQSCWHEWRGSPSMVVAIIDSGCDLHHPDLASKVWVNAGEICDDGIDNDNNGYIDDCHGWDWVDNDNFPLPQESGHGTASAGIIAAATNNQLGVAGICWNCRIMCLRFIRGVEGRVSNQVAAIDYAAKMGAKISNNSYGGYGFSGLEYQVLERARSYGHMFVSSAGNNNYNTDLPQYDHTPSIYNLDNIFAVGASTESGKKASFSNYGRVSVDIFAPGNKIVTVKNGGGYAVFSGTSFAAPMGAGAAALVWSKYPTLSTSEVIHSLISTCKQSEELEGFGVCGGVLNVGAAMEMAATIVRNKSQGLAYPFLTVATHSSNDSPKTVPKNDKNPGVDPSTNIDSNDQQGESQNFTPTAFTGYTGWLGAFLSGFNRAFTQTLGTIEDDGDVAVEDHRLNEQLHEPYLIFKGSDEEGHSVAIDPIYLNEVEFNKLITPYENALGVNRRNVSIGISDRGRSENAVLEGVGVQEIRQERLQIKTNNNSESDQKEQFNYRSQREKATSSIEHLLTSIAAPALDHIKLMSSAIRNFVWG